MTRPGPALAIVAFATATATAIGAPTAGDSLWDRAVADADAEAARATYDRALEEANEYVQLAGAEDQGSHKRRLVLRAVAAYEQAIAARPDAAEAHYRLGTTLFVYYLACDLRATSMCAPSSPDPAVMRDVVTHWRRFTTLAPLDTRGDSLLFPRAILHTKLATRDDFLLAISDYEAHIRRAEGDGVSDTSAQLANLAETYMMVGRLEDSIDTYMRAAARSGETSTIYGLAVALDRDGQRTRARQLIANLERAAFALFQADVMNGKTFFVPDGEKYYYFALVEEALGMPEQAIAHWNLFIASKAHPQFRSAAERNRDALVGKRSKTARSGR